MQMNLELTDTVLSASQRFLNSVLKNFFSLLKNSSSSPSFPIYHSIIYQTEQFILFTEWLEEGRIEQRMGRGRGGAVLKIYLASVGRGASIKFPGNLTPSVQLYLLIPFPWTGLGRAQDEAN